MTATTPQPLDSTRPALGSEDPFLYDTDSLHAIASASVVRRGLEYFNQNRVIDLHWEDASLCAAVEGSQPDVPYRVELSLRPGPGAAGVLRLLLRRGASLQACRCRALRLRRPGPGPRRGDRQCDGAGGRGAQQARAQRGPGQARLGGALVWDLAGLLHCLVDPSQADLHRASALAAGAQQLLHLPGPRHQPAGDLQAHRGGAAPDQQAPRLPQAQGPAPALALRLSGLGSGGCAPCQAPARPRHGSGPGCTGRQIFRRRRGAQGPPAGGFLPLHRPGPGPRRHPAGRGRTVVRSAHRRRRSPPAARPADPLGDHALRRSPARHPHPALSLPGRRGRLSGRHRPGAARRRHGPGQDPAGDQCRSLAGAP